jgi:hypothetical protein
MADDDIVERTRLDVTDERLDRAAELCCSQRCGQETTGNAGARLALAQPLRSGYFGDFVIVRGRNITHSTAGAHHPHELERLGGILQGGGGRHGSGSGRPLREDCRSRDIPHRWRGSFETVCAVPQRTSRQLCAGLDRDGKRRNFGPQGVAAVFFDTVSGLVFAALSNRGLVRCPESRTVNGPRRAQA